MTAPCSQPREPPQPKIALPPGACDTHAHVFGLASRFPYTPDRSYTPPDASPSVNTDQLCQKYATHQQTSRGTGLLLVQNLKNSK